MTGLRSLQELDNKKILLIGLLGLLFIYLDYSFFIQAQRRGLSQINTKIAKLNKDLDTLARDLLSMQRLKDKKGLAKPKKFIREEEIPALLESISTLANKNEVKIMQIRPFKEVKAPAPLPNPLLINLDLVAEFHHLGHFINDLENAEDFLAVVSLKVASQATDYLRQKVSLALRTYVKK